MPERFWPSMVFLAVLLIAAYISYQATLFYTLTDIWVQEEQTISMQAGGIGVLGRNITLRATLADPDFNDSACVFDLATGPYLLKGADESEYWSMTVFNRRGEAMFIASGPDAAAAGPYLLYADDYPTPSQSGGFKVVEVPTPRGIVVFRLLADRTNRKPLSDVQDELRCEPYRPAS
jgi:uncharacterized membrane protein